MFMTYTNGIRCNHFSHLLWHVCSGEGGMRGGGWGGCWGACVSARAVVMVVGGGGGGACASAKLFNRRVMCPYK